MSTTTREEWRTDDLGMAAYLVHVEHGMLHREWEGAECWFVFERTDELSEDVADYNGGVAEVDPERFLRTYNTVKRDMLQERPVLPNPKRNRQRAS